MAAKQYSVRSASLPTRVSNGLPKPMLKRKHLEAEFLGDPIMSELMDGHQDADRNQEGGEESPISSCEGSSAKLNQGNSQAPRRSVGVQNIAQSLDGRRIKPLQYLVNDR